MNIDDRQGSRRLCDHVRPYLSPSSVSGAPAAAVGAVAVSGAWEMKIGDREGQAGGDERSQAKDVAISEGFKRLAVVECDDDDLKQLKIVESDVPGVPKKFEDDICAVDAKRRRVEGVDAENEDNKEPESEQWEDWLETEAEFKEVDPEEWQEFSERMAAQQPEIVQGTHAWDTNLKELLEERLQERVERDGVRAIERPAGAHHRCEDDQNGDEETGGDPESRDDADFYDLEDGLEEARQLRVCPSCPRPSAEEIKKHKASGHSPYRSWCSICVWGAANDRPHRSREDPPPGAAPEVHADYTILRNRRGDKQSVPVLVSTDRSRGCVAAHVVPRKGAGGGWIVHQSVRDMQKWGIRGKAVLRSDGEFSIVDLLDRVGHLRQGGTRDPMVAPRGLSRKCRRKSESRSSPRKRTSAPSLGSHIQHSRGLSSTPRMS